MSGETNGMTRREVLGAGVASAIGIAAAGGAVACAPAPHVASGAGSTRVGSSSRMPVAYIPHGGGPWPFVDLGMPLAEVESLKGYLHSLATLPSTPPRALLIVSAHWEERVPTVTTSAAPPMLYDYYGFPEPAYSITWPAAGHPQVAARVRELLQAAGIDSASDANRGFDHGAFVPFKVAYPNADIPAVQLSLQAGLDPAAHLAIGRALAPLRDEGVFIVGSGMSYHNMRGFRDPSAAANGVSFDRWLREAAGQEQVERDRMLADWASAPGARASHPREEHLLPLMVIAGAAGDDRGQLAFAGAMMEKPILAFHFA